MVQPDVRDADALLRGLNPAQREAVLHRGTPVLVVAGPGTGKTRVVTHRVALSVLDAGIDPGRIVAITFTNRAAAEMRLRVKSLIGDDAEPRIGTFHWLCNAILRRHADVLGRDRSYHLLAPYEARGVLLEAARWAAPGVPGGREVVAAVSALKNGASRERAAAQVPVDPRVLDEVLNEYQRRLRGMNAMDLDDLQLLTVDLLEGNQGLRNQIRRSLHDLLVDEYQDTNAVQHRLIAALAPANGNVLAVGDDDQAIYGWRFAGGDAFEAFQRAFPDGAVVVLDQTYRSGKFVLRAAGALIEHNETRVARTLRTDLPAGEPPTCVATDDESDEAGWIAGEIARLIANESCSLEDIAILYRVNAQARALEDALIHARVPYQVVGSRRFYQRPEVMSAVSALRLTVDPASNSAMEHLLRQIRGVGERRLEVLKAAAGNNPLWDALQQTSVLEVIPVDVRGRVLELLQRLVERESIRTRSIVEAVDWAVQIARALHQMPDTGDDDVLGELRAALVGIAGSRGTVKSLADRLALQQADDPEVSGVRLLSLHAAKGLEFSVVFLAGLEEGLLPHHRSANEAGGVDEERRLCYVGVTRTRHMMYMTYARTRMLGGRAMHGVPSRFIAEMSAGNLRRISTHRAQTRPRLATVQTGERVRHTRWGVGTVVAVEGEGRGTLVSVAFDTGGRQRLQLCHAPLRRVE